MLALILTILFTGAAENGQRQKPPPPFTSQQFRAHVAYLASDELEGRRTGTSGCRKAADYIVRQFEAAQLSPLGDNNTFFQDFKAGDLPARTIVGLLRGEGALAEQAIVVSAHYDHIGTNPKLIAEGKDGIYNGADDDAAGISAVLLMAQAAHENRNKLPSPRRSILFIAFDAEEKSLAGSEYYVAHPRWPLSKTVAMINVEGIGRLKEGKLYAGDAESGEGLDGRLQRLAPQCGLSVETRLGGMRRADNATFNDRRVPALTLFTGMHIDYHQVADEVSKIDSEGGARITWLAYRLLGDLLADPRPIAFRETSPAFDAENLLRLIQRLGIIPELNEQGGKYPKMMFIIPGSPASKAGLRRGDEIMAMNGMTIDRVEDTPIIWNQLQLEQGLKLTVLRGGKQIELTIPPEVFERIQGPRIRAIENDLFQVTFSYRAAKQPKVVELAGNFDDGKRVSVRMDGPDKEGAFSTTLKLKRGRYDYSLVIDGTTVLDPENVYRSGDEKRNLLFVGTKP